MDIRNMSGTISVNGDTFSGRIISINNGKIFVDWNDVTPESKTITIAVTGNVESISADHCASITVEGTSGTVKTMSGNVKTGNVTGSVSTMSGDVRAESIWGSVSTMSGDISKSFQ